MVTLGFLLGVPEILRSLWKQNFPPDLWHYFEILTSTTYFTDTKESLKVKIQKTSQLQIRGGIHIFFLFLHENMLWVLSRCASNEYQDICFHGEIRINIRAQLFKANDVVS